METLGKAAGLLGAQDHLPATRLETLDGQERWYEIFASSIRFHGRPAIMAALIDVTAQKKALEEDAARQSQILQAAKLASIGVLAAGIAHEINNPNQAIMLAGQVAQDFWMETRSIVDEYAATHGEPSIGGGIYSEMRELIPHCLAAITDSASRIDAIISDLRDYARQDQPEESHPLDLNLVVRSSLTLLSSTLKKHTQRLEVDLAPHLPPVAGNYQKLEQVCINLLLNAGQSLPDPTGRITVTTRHDTGKTAVVLTVSDEGTGIRPEDLPHITEPFFTTRRDRGGTGLGLSVTSAIVEQHGGSLAHESSPGKGTTATVVLPALG
jgi:polar amino acid transport system substrate-binding protein